MKKIIFDVDGCMLDFANPFIKWYNARNEDKITQSDLKYYDFNRDNIFDSIKQFWATPNFGSLSFMDNYIFYYFNKIAEKNESIIVTAIPEEYAEIRMENLKWFNYGEIYFKPNGKTEFIINELKADIAIEDEPERVKKLSEAGIKVFYPQWPYTVGLEKYGTMYKSWRELYAKLA